MKRAFQIITLLSCVSAFAQLPETEIFLANIEIKNKLIKIEKAENITNKKGYDNQPSFLPDSKSILFSSETETNGKIHVCQYEIRSKKTKRLTVTKTSEYSPTVAPDGNNISCVVVEEDSSQRIWLYGLKTGNKISCLHEGTDSIGYHSWLGKDSILYYKLTSPHSLRVLNLKTGEDNWLCDHPTRSFKKINSYTFFYVIHEEAQNLIYTFDLRTKKATLFAIDKPENQDYVWQEDLGLVKSEQSKIYHYAPETKVWAEVADLSSYGIKKITRFAFSVNKKLLAVVSNLN